MGISSWTVAKKNFLQEGKPHLCGWMGRLYYCIDSAILISSFLSFELGPKSLKL